MEIFLKAVSDLGFSLIRLKDKLVVMDRDSDMGVANVSLNEPYMISTEYANFIELDDCVKKKLLEACFMFGRSLNGKPKKKYYLEYITADGHMPVYVNVDRLTGEIFLDSLNAYCDDEVQTQFTEDEIKQLRFVHFDILSNCIKSEV